MAEFRWILLAAGIIVLALVFWLGRRESRGERFSPGDMLRSRLGGSAALASGPGATESAVGKPVAAGSTSNPERIITIRLMARGRGSFGGDELVSALRETGLRHGRFGIFHRHDAADDTRVMFSAASLIEPGSFDLARLDTTRFPGVSLFIALPGETEVLAGFDAMMSTARELAGRLDGELLDEQGSRLSVQRERYLREEVIQFQHRHHAS